MQAEHARRIAKKQATEKLIKELKKIPDPVAEVKEAIEALERGGTDELQKMAKAKAKEKAAEET